MIPLPFLSSQLFSRRDHQPLSGYPSRCWRVLLVTMFGSPPRLTSSLLFVETLSVASQPKRRNCASCARTSPSHPWLRTSPRFSKRVVRPAPSDGGRTRLTSASRDDLW